MRPDKTHPSRSPSHDSNRRPPSTCAGSEFIGRHSVRQRAELTASVRLINAAVHLLHGINRLNRIESVAAGLHSPRLAAESPQMSRWRTLAPEMLSRAWFCARGCCGCRMLRPCWTLAIWWMLRPQLCSTSSGLWLPPRAFRGTQTTAPPGLHPLCRSIRKRSRDGGRPRGTRGSGQDSQPFRSEFVSTVPGSELHGHLREWNLPSGLDINTMTVSCSGLRLTSSARSRYSPGSASRSQYSAILMNGRSANGHAPPSRGCFPPLLSR